MRENERHGVADDGKTQSGAQLGAFCRYRRLNMSSNRLIAIVGGILRVGRNGDAVGRHKLCTTCILSAFCIDAVQLTE
jgi:hypothetical protein